MKENGQTLLYLGGCRSGKSRLAEEYCRLHFDTRTYLATMTKTDDKEMTHRIHLHKMQRGDQWHLVEEPFDLCKVVQGGQAGGVILIDCLTMWITNMLLTEQTDRQIEHEVKKLCAVLVKPACAIVLVANEVGLGIVPESPLGRRFRDLAGWANQQVAAVVNQVFFVAGGLPIILKGKGA